MNKICQVIIGGYIFKIWYYRIAIEKIGMKKENIKIFIEYGLDFDNNKFGLVKLWLFLTVRNHFFHLKERKDGI